jgi:hypothetical protein
MRGVRADTESFKKSSFRRAKHFFTPLAKTCVHKPISLSLSTLNQKETASMDVEMQESGATPSSGYCWTHGSSRNRRHTSVSCKNKHADHQDAATFTNKMGGSTEVIEAETKPTTTDKNPRSNAPTIGYCWTHGSSRNRRHTSMTCLNKHADHQDAATIFNKMGGSTEENQGISNPPSDDDTAPLSYCWTHGLCKNLSHTSMTCNRKQTNHQDEATVANKMGGSTKILNRSE